MRTKILPVTASEGFTHNFCWSLVENLVFDSPPIEKLVQDNLDKKVGKSSSSSALFAASRPIRMIRIIFKKRLSYFIVLFTADRPIRMIKKNCKKSLQQSSQSGRSSSIARWGWHANWHDAYKCEQGLKLCENSAPVFLCHYHLQQPSEEFILVLWQWIFLEMLESL